MAADNAAVFLQSRLSFHEQVGGLRTITPGVDQIQDIVHVGVTVSIAVAGVILTVCAQKQQDVIDVNG